MMNVYRLPHLLMMLGCVFAMCLVGKIHYKVLGKYTSKRVDLPEY